MLAKIAQLCYSPRTVKSFAVGFGSLLSSGTEALCHKVHSFFYAFHLMVGGEMGSSRLPVQNPVYQPVTSFHRQSSLVASDGGFKSLFWSHP
jgi:hypothetical protein